MLVFDLARIVFGVFGLAQGLSQIVEAAAIPGTRNTMVHCATHGRDHDAKH